MKILTATRERSAKACEQLAKELLGWNAVMTAIGDAAGKGLTAATIAPSYPVDLRATEAARETVARLKKEGFVCAWKLNRPKPDMPGCVTLEIDWSERDTLATASEPAPGR